MGEFAVALIVPALVYVGVTLLKAVVARNWETVWWVLGGWVIGFLALVLAAQSQWADQITVGDTSLDDLTVWSLIIGGLFAGALASLGFDVLRSISNIGQSQPTPLQRAAFDSVAVQVLENPTGLPLGPDGKPIVPPPNPNLHP